jgi:hypothetical protein
MLEKDPDELVLDMTSERCLPATENLLGRLEMTDDLVVLVFKVLARACDCGTTRSGLQKLLSTVPQSTYLSLHLSSYINRLNLSRKDDYELENEIKSMIKLFSEVLRKLPSSFPHLPLPQLSIATSTFVSCGRLGNSEIHSSIEGLMALKDEMAEKVKKETEETSRRPRRRNPGEEGKTENSMC